jgi:UDP-2,3-diacylglucosamine pyrophosphatase LpxH
VLSISEALRQHQGSISSSTTAAAKMESTQQQQSKPGTLPEEVLKMIHGHVHHEDKKQLYQDSLQKWVSLVLQRQPLLLAACSCTPTHSPQLRMPA